MDVGTWALPVAQCRALDTNGPSADAGALLGHNDHCCVSCRRPPYNSSSSSTLTPPAVLAIAVGTSLAADVEIGGVPVGPEPFEPPTIEPRAALKLWVAENFSPPAPWSMLGLAFLSGLPTNASGGTSDVPVRPVLLVGVAFTALVLTDGSDTTG